MTPLVVTSNYKVAAKVKEWHVRMSVMCGLVAVKIYKHVLHTLYLGTVLQSKGCETQTARATEAP